ncbi:alpha/beta fold hydrolase [Herbiconiux sp. P15]|uniref:alpha/beta fold hydrolase n=1 Tax=Herbiconiux liukaitaii TaxID=3342799 RepID=UPI0035B78D43
MKPASLPPASLAEYEPRFSRLVSTEGVGVDVGSVRTWHVLDNAASLAALGVEPTGTILAVHGNPTWSYLWRRLVTAATDAAATDAASAAVWRVVAVDQLEMGFSERTGHDRGLEQRIRDLGALSEALGIDGPVVTLGHDWGGVVSLGWAVRHPESLVAVAALNTAVWQPEGLPIPAPLTLARARGVRTPATALTTAFLDTTLALAKPALPRGVRDAYRAPYARASDRRGIDAFVEDIPVGPSHRSYAALVSVAEGLRDLEVPALFLWGPEDPIFSDRYLNDLLDRLPHADVHRFEGAGHLIAEGTPYAATVLDWLATLPTPALRPGTPEAASAPASAAPQPASGRHAAVPTDDAHVPLWAALDARAQDRADAVIDMSAVGADGEPLRVSWRTLADRVDRIATGLGRIGVTKGDRVSLLVQPGATLTAVVYACLRIGAVVVVADAGLGLKGLGRAIRGAWPDYVIADTPGLVAARAGGWPGERISVRQLPPSARWALGVRHTLPELVAAKHGDRLPTPPRADDDAAVLFTSGSTGPAKGVVYTHRQLSAVRDTLAAAYDVTDDPGLVTGFAPFALLGPALGTRSVSPRMNHTSPRTLTAQAMADATRASGARIAFLSPAAILGVTGSADALTTDDRDELRAIRRFLSTGAPIGRPLLDAVADLMPNARAHTPYGMTECLLVTDITREGIIEAADRPDVGVCVGLPIVGNRVLISALDASGAATGAPSSAPGVLGEIVISAPHLKKGYDRLWRADREAVRDTAGTAPTAGTAATAMDLESATAGDGAGTRWHRTGDIGHLDEAGRVWIEGRIRHVMTTDRGLRAPVGVEQAIEGVSSIRRAAAVGVGPAGVQQIVAVVETTDRASRAQLADTALADDVRRHSTEPLVAVFVVPELPTDIRHNSKIDRTALASWAAEALSGGRLTPPAAHRAAFR